MYRRCLLSSAAVVWGHGPSFEQVQFDIIHDGVAAPSADVAAETLRVAVDPRDKDLGTYAMRFWADTRYWNGKADAPVFLAMGGEGTAGPPGGQMMEMAEQHGAIGFSIEHRYYGQSIPTQDFSTPNMKWLQAPLALADAAAFQKAMVASYDLSFSGRWIPFGGSYSGQLAAWARVSYPELFYAAVSSSAPVTALINYEGYEPIVANALTDEYVGGSEACHDAVKASFATLEDYIANNRSALEGLFNTCGPVITEGDVFDLLDFTQDTLRGLVQYNVDLPGRTNIRSRCVQMTNSSFGKTPFDRLVGITRENAGGRCISDGGGDGSGSSSISWTNHIAALSEANNSGRSWPYQLCADGVGHDLVCKPELGCIFSEKYDSRPFFTRRCEEVFGITEEQTLDAEHAISKEFGDTNPPTSRVIFINGDIDPYHYGSVLQNASDLMARDIVAYMVKGGSHCQDMSRTSSSDTPYMETVKAAKAATVSRWVSESTVQVV